MSKFLFICHREEKSLSKEVRMICENITPDNFEPSDPITFSDNKGITYGIYNPNETNLINNSNLCLGQVNSEKWHEIGNNDLDGNFAIVRSNSQKIELVSDIVASRTIWYFYNHEYFVASSSQRLLVSYLGSFELNNDAISWMLATGSLGYGNSWDKRIKCLPGDSRLIFNRETWKSELIENKVIFKSVEKNQDYHKNKLKNDLKSSIENINVDFKKWALPLSGGYDSRGILLNIKNTAQLNTVTWGLESSLNEYGSDAYVAKQISKKMSTNHNYYHTDFSEESISIIFDRFLKIGEGRTDNIGGYLDGFEIWKKIYQEEFL